ncbi:DUF308 domain-containing protein [Methanobrevibacter sp.]|uniref:DUF308 domain-containing protein n=1 Tax=Methanobrevibacter sp. TaxID=66852 RepID=UPI0038901318
MEVNKIAGILSIVLGLIFMIFPIFSTALVSVFIGLSLIFLGIAAILINFSTVNIIIGIISIICGLIFILNISALSFLLGFQFYIIAILLVLIGVTGFFAGDNISKKSSVVIIILGIIAFILGGLSINNPIYAILLIGISLIVEGIILYISE